MHVEERLARLEKELARKRRSYWWVFVLAGAVLVYAAENSFLPGVLAAAPKNASREIRANKFVVEDDKGNARIELSCKGADISVKMLDEQGKLCTELSTGEKGTTLLMQDGQRRPSIILGSTKAGGGLAFLNGTNNSTATMGMLAGKPVLCFTDENHKSRLKLSSEKDGPRLGLFDEKEVVRLMLATSNERSGVSVYDENGKIRGVFSMGKGGPGVALLDENEKHRAALGLADVTTALTLFDRAYCPRVVIQTSNERGPEVEVRDKDGRKQWLAPTAVGSPVPDRMINLSVTFLVIVLGWAACKIMLGCRNRRSQSRETPS